MSLIWRFYADDESRWRWERFRNGALAGQSQESYDNYDEAIKAASAVGYVFQMAQPSIRPPAHPHAAATPPVGDGQRSDPAARKARQASVKG